jgi:CRP/FNR family transcriptional regulator, cyclic AMP receptor protein
VTDVVGTPGAFWSLLEDERFARPQAERRFRAGQRIFYRGDSPDCVLVLRSGLVKILATTDSGREVVLAFRGPGELVGEQSVLDDAPRAATVEAVKPVEALSVSKPDFLRFLRDHPDAALTLLGMLSMRLRDADAKRIEFSRFTTLQRVALRLLEYADQFGYTKEGVIHVELAQEELAGATGSSIESVGRALQTMRALKCVDTPRRRDIAILDREALEALHKV